MSTFQLQLVTIAISLLQLMLWGTAALGKWNSLSTPEWFLKQFQNTFFATLPGGIPLSYWMIASAELVLAILFLASLFVTSLLPWALIGSLFLIVILIVGLRLTFDFQGSANMFVYFGTTLLSLWFLKANS